jgi:hypothetical protein
VHLAEEALGAPVVVRGISRGNGKWRVTKSRQSAVVRESLLPTFLVASAPEKGAPSKATTCSNLQPRYPSTRPSDKHAEWIPCRVGNATPQTQLRDRHSLRGARQGLFASRLFHKTTLQLRRRRSTTHIYQNTSLSACVCIMQSEPSHPRT